MVSVWLLGNWEVLRVFRKALSMALQEETLFFCLELDLITPLHHRRSVSRASTTAAKRASRLHVMEATAVIYRREVRESSLTKRNTPRRASCSISGISATSRRTFQHTTCSTKVGQIDCDSVSTECVTCCLSEQICFTKGKQWRNAAWSPGNLLTTNRLI